MPQKQDGIKPLFLNTDTDLSELKPNESPYLKSAGWDINANPETGAGTNNPTGEGQNLLAISTTRSNEKIPNAILPTGYNKHLGSYESVVTRELYHFYYNDKGNHGICVLSGDTGIWQRVIVDPELQFSDDAEAFIANHRVTLRFTRDRKGVITEKHLLITEGQSWQKFINVIAAIKTNGFDDSLFPYWVLQPPHFDRRELLEWPVRPPMVKPIATTISNTAADSGKIGQLADKAFQFATSFINTDGRVSTLGLYSLPLIVKSSDFQNNTNNIPKNAIIKIPAGSPLTEKILIWARRSEWDKNSIPTIAEWSDWYIYDTIEKFTSSGNNSPQTIGNDYWLRTNQWAAYNYDATFNTIEYTFDNSRVPDLADQDTANMIETGMPQLSVGMTDIGDAVLLGDNRYGYPNFNDNVKDNLDFEVIEKTVEGCTLPLRDMYFYIYVGRPGTNNNYTSQVGYYLGDDKEIKFGGLDAINQGNIYIDPTESGTFDLNFADKNAFQIYLKGTPYTAVGEWYKVNLDNSIVKINGLYDFNNSSQIDEAKGILASGAYFVCRCKVTVPAGKYNVAVGRHNVPLAGDYRGTSTYVYGVANSRVKTTINGISYIRPNALVSYSKEMEVDCTSGNVDTWGNNADLFYVYCPYREPSALGFYTFAEGYLRESSTTIIPVEMFPYSTTLTSPRDWGKFTDKNGFYWAYSITPDAQIKFNATFNCATIQFVIPHSQGGPGWKQNALAFLASYNGGSVGDCNRVVYSGRITDLTGTINYSNIAISIKDGNTVYTKPDGTFTLIVHNGIIGVLRQSNIYVNAGGNFIITTANCGSIPLFYYNEALVPCISCIPRNFPQILLGIKIDYISVTSLKEGAKYSCSIYGADLAGRVMFVNEVKNILIPSFLQRNNTKATFLRMLVTGALQLTDYPDIKWIIPCISKNLTQKRYLDWVGDYIKYIDSNGNVVTDSPSAVFCAISITSLYNYNVANNFSVLANYQFVTGDRLRIYDDGANQLYDVATYGDQIDIEIYGTNFNQAAINAGLIPPVANTVFNATASQAELEKDVTIIVQYDPRLDKLIDKTGFWVETYTPTKEKDIIPYQDANGAFPVINGEIAEYTGGGQANPQYNFPTSIDIDYWDTYFFQRSITIPDTGTKFFAHIFQSPNITDNFGKEITSGGRRNVVNKNAKQLWFGGDTIKSDDFVKEGLVNGLAMFRAINRRNFSTYPFGDIVAMISQRNVIAIICENDYFIVDYNYHYVYANEQGAMVTNLSEGLSTPHQKTSGKYGLLKKDTGTFISADGCVFWLDSKNTGFIKMDYKQAIDITQLQEDNGERGGIQSYLNSKISFINEWNKNNTKEKSFDSVAGIDQEKGNVYLTFRNRRNNSNDITSYVNMIRDIDLKASETLVYSIQYRGWLRFEGFAPEGYGKLRGQSANVEMFSFAAGLPYKHNNTKNDSFLIFYGVQCEPIIKGVFNGDKANVQVFQSMAHDSNPNGWIVDLMYTTFINSFTYLSANQFKKKQGQWYAGILRNMNSYPSNNPDELFRSMLFDGYCMRGRYLVFRMVGANATLNKYNELNNIYILKAPSGNNKK